MVIVLSRLSELLGELIYPTRCLGCETRGTWFCELCQTQSRHRAHATSCLRCRRAVSKPGLLCLADHKTLGLQGLATYGDYRSEPLERALHWFKYRGVFAAGQALVDLALPRWQSVLSHRSSWSNIVPIPSTKQHERERGFSPTHVLAKALAARTNFLLSPHLTRQNGTPQVGLDRKAREVNMREALSWHGPTLTGSILLIDDVITTGATLRAGATELRKHGAKEVWALTLAEESAD